MMKMRNKIDILRRAARENGFFIVLFLIYVLWMLPGVFPLYSYEGDALSISWGCEEALRTGTPMWDLESYGYWMQPLVYYLIFFTAKVLPWVSCEAIYMVLTAIFAFVMIGLILAFAHKLSGINPVMLLIALYLFPEAAALAFYPNSAVFVLVFFVGGLLLTLYKRVWAACVLFCVAPLFRLDILYMYPLIVLLNVYVFGLNKKSILLSLADALLVAAVTFVGYYLLHADIILTLEQFNRWSDIINLFTNLKAILGFYTLLNFILLPAGLYLLFRSGNKWFFWMIVLALVIVHFINRDFGNATKHYCYLLPFVVIATGTVINSLWAVRNKLRWLFISATAAIVLFNIVSVSFVFTSGFTPGYDSMKKFIPSLDLLDVHLFGRNVSVGIGGGTDFATGDEFMLLTGNFFYPQFIHNIKVEDSRRAEEAEAFVKSLEGEVALFLPRYEDEMRLNYSLTKQNLMSDATKILFWSIEIDLRKHVQEIPTMIKTNLASYAAEHSNAKIYVCCIATISFKIEGILRGLEREGLLREVGKGIYEYCRVDNLSDFEDN